MRIGVDVALSHRSRDLHAGGIVGGWRADGVAG